MLIPVFTIFATKLDNVTPTLMGIALGSYGLSQAILQMPFGMLSDRYGRKKIITLGLILFALGSLLGATTHSIYGMIIARILQGMGAIGSVLIALLADLTRDEQRTQAMAVIGVTIGISFSLAMVLSPTISYYFGLAGIFYLTAIFALCGLILLHVVIPTPKKERFHVDSESKPSLLKSVILNHHLQRLNAGIFIQHIILTATFFVTPQLLLQYQKQGNLSQQWHFYLPLMVIAFIAMLPFIFLAERKQRMKSVFLLSVLTTSITQFFLIFTAQNWLSFCGLMGVYFVSFNILEASLPSLISKEAPVHSKGTAMGVYSSSQFLGIFVGGTISGILFEYAGITSIFISNALLGLLWLILATPMKPNMGLFTLIMHHSVTTADTEKLLAQLLAVKGVSSAIIVAEEKVIYLRVDKKNYVAGSAEKSLSAPSKSNF